MPKEMTHDAIARSYIESGAVNFDALGKWVNDVGARLTVDDHGLHGVAFGKFNQLACFLTAFDLDRVIGGLGNVRQVAAAMDANRVG
jgi:hypothetical protein